MLRKILTILIAAILSLLLYDSVPSAPVQVEVRFWHGDTLLQTQTVNQGTVASDFIPDLGSGLRFTGWNHKVVSAQQNTDYYATCVPRMDQHVPYLYPRKDGFLHPDDPFLGRDLIRAVYSLAPKEAIPYFPQFPEEDSIVTIFDLERVFWAFYPEICPSIFFKLPKMQELSRSEACSIINDVLGRTEHTVRPAGNAFGFPDLPPSREDYARLMEASVAHMDGKEEWKFILLETGFQPGIVLEKGRLRSYDRFGYLMTNTVLTGGFVLDEDGYYTSGNPELDQYIFKILHTLQEDHPGADRDILLRYAYQYVRDSFKYLRKQNHKFGATGWEIEDAITMFSTKKGNCYNYAAAFWALARGLGYDAYAISGYVGGANSGLYPHGWVRIITDGVPYYYDTELEMAHRSNWNPPNLYKLPMQTARLWHYVEANS